MVLGTVIAGLICCEIALRVLRPGDNVHTTATLGLMAPDPELVWVLRPGVRKVRNWAGRKALIRTDHEGRRVPDRPSPVGSTPIVFAGDSYVFGNEAQAEETFVHLVGDATGHGSVNLGVPGYTLGQGCGALRRFLAARPGAAHAFLAIYVGNDLETGPYPAAGHFVDDRGYLRRSSGRWDDLHSFAVRHSRLAFYGQIAYERLRRLSAPPDAGTAPMASNSRWIYDGADGRTGRRAPAGPVSAVHDDARRRGTSP